MKRLSPAKRKKLAEQGINLGSEKKFREAKEVWKELLRDDPQQPFVVFNLAYCLEQLSDNPADRYEAAEFYESVIQNPQAPVDLKAKVMSQFGLMLMRVGEEEKAITAYQFAISLDPNLRAAKVNLADAQRITGDYTSAMEGYGGLISADPNNADAHMCRGMLALLLGDYENGWEEYRWRWKSTNFSTRPFVSNKPQYDGEDLEGKRLLLISEQGFGDSFQFLRYCNAFKRKGAIVLFKCIPALKLICEGVFGLYHNAEHFAESEYDYWLPLMDAPRFVKVIPEAHCIRQVRSWPYWSMQATNVLRKRIGLVWAGSPSHGRDKARSIPAEAFQTIIDSNPQHDFYSFQAGPRQHEVEKLSPITDLAPEITDWAITAQMLQCMDLLVSVDTACVHLAGAVGMPVWMLTPYSPDWRWGLGSEKSVWYPKLRMFRQKDQRTWNDVINQIAEELKSL